MLENDSKDLRLVPISVELERSIHSLNEPLSNYLEDLGLPTENVLYSISERKKVIDALKDALAVLPINSRAKAYYLTKFTVAITVGLFDGALSYLWDETISALRKLVLKFDLEYFFSVAETVGSRYKGLSSSEDLDEIGEHDLLDTIRRIGLISDVNYRRLDHVNYMRNHASAAHPNDNEIDGFEILDWLSICLKHAITAEPDHSVISLKRLLDNIRTKTIPSNDFSVIGSDIVKQPRERIDDFLWTLFGMYTDPRQTSLTKANITNLCKYVWDASTEDRKYEIGSKFGIFRKNGDVPRKEAANEFLTIVRGQKYKDEDSLAGELIEKLNVLKSVHYGWDNFYNEYPHALMLNESLPQSGNVPRAARSLWVKVICTCYVGNGHGYREGVDESALIYYKKFVENFTEAEVVDFLHLMTDIEFTLTLSRNKPDQRIRQLAHILKSNTANVHVQRALDSIINGPQSKLDHLCNTKDFKQALEFIPKHQ